ncbi:hypothetical protein CR513_27825, partial [Mucuna pruriens]
MHKTIKYAQDYKVKYQQCRQELQQSAIEEGTFANDSSSASINDNDVYYNIVGGNIYGLGRLTNKFIRSTCIPTNLIEMPMVQQIEEMRMTIHKLNNELLGKEVKEKSLEEKVVQLMHNHEE